VGREATQFKKGQPRPEGAGRKKGTPNKPVTVKLAMKTFTGEKGSELLAFADEVMTLPNWLQTEKGYAILLADKISVWQELLRYGIGKHANHATDTGRGDIQVVPKYPIGTDPKAMDRLILDEIERRGYVPGRQGPQAPQKDRGKIFNDALLRAVGKKPRELPKDVQAELTTEDGVPLDIVEEELPRPYDPERQGETE
jgi:hypothetical protein